MKLTTQILAQKLKKYDIRVSPVKGKSNFIKGKLVGSLVKSKELLEDFFDDIFNAEIKNLKGNNYAFEVELGNHKLLVILLKEGRTVDFTMELGVNRGDQSFQYMLLNRLQRDCEYAINNNTLSRIWGQTLESHIKKMKELYKILSFKPHWLSWEEIIQYEEDLLDID